MRNLNQAGSIEDFQEIMKENEIEYLTGSYTFTGDDNIDYEGRLIVTQYNLISDYWDNERGEWIDTCDRSEWTIESILETLEL